MNRCSNDRRRPRRTSRRTSRKETTSHCTSVLEHTIKKLTIHDVRHQGHIEELIESIGNQQKQIDELVKQVEKQNDIIQLLKHNMDELLNERDIENLKHDVRELSKN
jgi:hypothetical protein